MTPYFLAFPDGVLHYVCAECTALCCKGAGMGGSLDREMGRLIQIYPALASMAARRRGRIVEFTTPTMGCHFLRSDNRCGVEVDHGRSLKPGVCVLFPFNHLGRIGRTVTIRPHFLCPLRVVVPARPGDVQGTHEKVLEALRESALMDDGFLSRVPAARLHRSERPASVVAREERFREVCASGIEHRTFRESLELHLDEEATLGDFLPRALAVLRVGGTVGACPPDLFDRLFQAMAPSLRLDMLHLGEPAMSKALALGEVMVRYSWSLSGSSPTPQAVYRAFESLSPVLRLLARDPEPLRLPSVKRAKIPAFGDAEMTFALFSAHRWAERGGSVLEVLEGVMKPGMSAADRSVLLLELGMRAEEATSKRAKPKSGETEATGGEPETIEEAARRGET